MKPYNVAFHFKGETISVRFDKSNNAWFFANHVGKILQIGAPQDFLKLLEYKEKGEIENQPIIAHYGIHKLVKISPSPLAEAFQEWAVRTVPQFGKNSVPAE